MVRLVISKGIEGLHQAMNIVYILQGDTMNIVLTLHANPWEIYQRILSPLQHNLTDICHYLENKYLLCTVMDKAETS